MHAGLVTQISLNGFYLAFVTLTNRKMVMRLALFPIQVRKLLLRRL